MTSHPTPRASSASAEGGIHNLPPEVLRLIFIQPTLLLHAPFSPQSKTTHVPCRFPVPRRTTAPLLLTHVCSSWRRTALDTPSLWSAVSLGSLGTAPSSDIWILPLFLQRVGDTLPLDIELHYDLPGSSQAQHPPAEVTKAAQSESYLGGVRSLAKFLIPFRERWRSLTVNVLILGALEPYLNSLVFGTPMLEELVVSTKYSGFFGTHYDLDLSKCPRLSEVRILSPMIYLAQPLSQDARPLQLPHVNGPVQLLENLTCLEHLFCQSQLEILTWLACAPRLERLSIELYAAQPITPPMKTAFVLPCLTSVSITCFYGDCDPGTLLDSLTLPNLSFFRLAMADINRSEESEGPWTNVIRLLERSKSKETLTLLSLPDTPMGPEELRRTLRLAPRCRHVSIGGEAVTDAVLRAIEGPIAITPADVEAVEDSTSLLPNLLSLELHDVRASPASIFSLARSRAWLKDDSRDPKRTLRNLVIEKDVLDEAYLLNLPETLSVMVLRETSPMTSTH